MLFAGTAQDSGGGLDYVQVSTDGGQTWHLASGGGSWSYSFSPAQNGPLTALVRAADSGEVAQRAQSVSMRAGKLHTEMRRTRSTQSLPISTDKY